MELIEKIVGVLLIGLALGIITLAINAQLGLAMVFGFAAAIGILALVSAGTYLISGEDSNGVQRK